MDISRRHVLGATMAAVATRALPACTPAVGATPELVVGPGAWCWFQSPRATVDAAGTLWLGSTEGSGAPAPGSVDVTGVDLHARRVVRRRSLARDRVDDHTAPSLLATPGGIQVAWAPHRQVDWLEVGRLEGPLQRLTRAGALRPPGRGTAYASAHLVAGENWLLYRGESFSWNLLTSVDGTAWSSRGLVVAPSSVGDRPYLLACAEGGRLHLLVTDGNPTEVRGCSAWAGVVDADGTIATTSGRRVGRVGTAPVAPTQLTSVRRGAVGPSAADDVAVWIADLSVVHGIPTALLTVRDRWPEGAMAVGRWRHRFERATPDRLGRWRVEALGQGGSELYANQPDYCGLGALDPRDPRAVVVSTDVHPATGEPLRSSADGRVHRELFLGRRQEATWRWAPLTSNSIEDNLRPVVVHTPAGRAVAWMRGTYRSWTQFDTSIVVRFA